MNSALFGNEAVCIKEFDYRKYPIALCRLMASTFY